LAKKILLWGALIVGLMAITVIYLTPWPSVLVIRSTFDKGAKTASDALEAKVPANIKVETGLSYDSADKDARFDIYRPAAATPDGPTIVWFHGGGFVSGRRGDIANYLKILAGHGFTVVNVDYTIAPEATYPTPIRQSNKALAYLSANHDRLGINADRLVLAGDSAGAQIAAQTAAVITNPDYALKVGIKPGIDAGQLAGALLHCGVYDISGMGKGGGILGWFVKSTTWAYSGRRDWRDAPGFDTMSVAPHVTAAFPPTFISAGNADPLGPQSVALAKALAQRGVRVTKLFFPPNYQPPLEHEYQFNLDIEAGRLALDRSVAWLRTL
jgi:acetyl esterase/lipase